MAPLDHSNKIALKRAQLGAHDAFFLDNKNAYYIVERGHVDLFAAAKSEKGDVVLRNPFISRISEKNVFFGATVVRDAFATKGITLVLQAVPSRNAVILEGTREQFATPDTFDLGTVTLIEDWVAATTEFMVRADPPPPRNAFLLEADPEVLYEARSAVSAHHLETLWVHADRPVHLAGRPEMEIASGTTLPLSEHLWLALPEDTHVSAIHTPGIIAAGKLWEALDRHSVHLLQSANRAWLAGQQQEGTQRAKDVGYKDRLRVNLIRNLGGLLGHARQTIEPVQRYPNAIHAAAAIVAESEGVQLVDSPVSPESEELFDAVTQIVAPSGIRTRRIELSEGWQRRDQPSFIGMLDGSDLRPVAVISRKRGSFEMVDPASGESLPVNRKRANTLEAQGVQLYFPLDQSVDSGLAAVRQAVRGRRRDILGVVLMGALGAVIALLTPILTGQLLAEIIPRVDVSMWVAVLGALIIGAFATAAVSIVGALSLLRIEARIDETLQTAIWNRLVSLPLPFFRDFLSGDLADRANGVSLIRQLLTGAASASLIGGVFSLFSFLLLFYYSSELALWAGLVVLVFAGVSWYFTTRQIRYQRAAFEAQGAIDGLVFQLIVGLSKIRQANAELNALNNWSEKYATQKREHLSARKWIAAQLTFNALFLPLSQLLLSALIWYSLIEGATGEGFPLADYLSFNAAFGQFVAGATGLTATLTTISAVLPLFERVLPIIEAKPESVGGTVLQDVSGRIECEHVSFRYPSAGRETLHDVSFDIRPGEYVAFLGPSGAGKSTLYRLLLGFERPTTGSVIVDGHDLLSLDLRSLRRHFGVVLQNGQILPDNIFGIIAGEAPLTEREAFDAARAVGLDEDIEALPMGMSTVISEGGLGLSGGQKQRLLVARALARKPRVLLFDEATSMLDNRTQDTIRNTLRGMSVTRILIAHRLSTVVDTDRLYVMQDGRIVETGHYSDLIEKGGILAEMASRQLV